MRRRSDVSNWPRRSRGYAKSRQDVPKAALATVLHDDCCETPAFGTSARGLAENERSNT